MTKFKELMVIVLATLVTFLGFLLIFYYLQNEFSILTFILGLLGWFVSFSPAYEGWKEFFNEIINKNQNENENN